MRGEHYDTFEIEEIFEGSSPHARGALEDEDADFWSIGIIPACAGSTTFTTCQRVALKDHPRMRGEHPCMPR